MLLQVIRERTAEGALRSAMNALLVSEEVLGLSVGHRNPVRGKQPATIRLITTGMKPIFLISSS
jgi:hypothetical protein